MLSDYHVQYIAGRQPKQAWFTTGVVNKILWPTVLFTGLSIANRKQLEEAFGPAIRQELYILVISAILIVAGILLLPSVQRFLVSRPIEFLGRVSFGIYLLHFYIMNILLENFNMYALREHLLATHVHARGIFAITLFLVESPLLLVATHFFEKYIDRSSVAFAKWLEQTLISTDSVSEL